ncbi:MAG: M6 family metalloprotease domain-containing protein [Bacteroidales bacterium]|nr:M6 family metalloprotease domain-containing protein [Bacteroidales bacterium]
MRRLYGWILLLTWCSLALPLWAVVAFPEPVQVRQPDGSLLTVCLHGDEHSHFTTDVTGHLLCQDESGYYRPAAFQADGSLRIVDSGASHLSQLPFSVRARSQARRMQANKRLSSLRSARSFAHPSKTLVILAAFKDVAFNDTDEASRQYFDNLLNQEGYSANGATGSVRDYYSENSGGLYVPQFVVVGPYVLPREMAYYGKNDADGNEPNADQMAYDAVKAAYENGVVLSDFDNDADGWLDNIYIFYAGYGESDGGGENTVWPHSFTLAHKGSLGGMKLGNYACSSERNYGGNRATIGTFCHEFGHTLGLPDFYDTDYEDSGGTGQGLGNLSLMSSGNYNNQGRTPPYLNTEELMELGWISPQQLTAGAKMLPPIVEKQSFMLETDNPGEYFLFENRQRTRWDAYLSSHGLLIYHVDKSSNYVHGTKASSLWNSNEINIYPDHQCMYNVRKNVSDATSGFYPSGSGLTDFSPNSVPAAVDWVSLPLKYGLYDIDESEGTISFNVKNETHTIYLGGVVSDRKGTPVASALLYLIRTDLSAPVARRGRMHQSTESYTTLSDAQGHYLFGGLPAGSYKLVCYADDFARQEYNLTLSEGSYLHPVMLSPKGEEDYVGTISWVGHSTSQVGSTDGWFAAAARWAAPEVQDYAGYRIGKVFVGLAASSSSDMTVTVYYGDRETVSRTIPNASLTDNSTITIDFLTDTTTLYPGEELLVEVALSQGGWLFTDDGPAVSGRGDLYRDVPGAGWSGLLETDGIDCNWAIEADWYRLSEYVPMTSFSLDEHQLRLTVGSSQVLTTDYAPLDATATEISWSSSDDRVARVDQRGVVTALQPGKTCIRAVTDKGNWQDSCLVGVVPTLASSLTSQVGYHAAALAWAGEGSDSWHLTWTDPLTSESRDTTLLQPWVGLDGLQPANNYRIELRSMLDGVTVDSLATSLTTRTVPVSPVQNVLYINTPAASRDSLVLLDVKQRPEGSTLHWYWDGKSVGSPVLRWTDRESHWLELRIVDTSGRCTEMIRRKIVYPNEVK